MTILRRLRIAATIRSAASATPGRLSGSCRPDRRGSRKAAARDESSTPPFSRIFANKGGTPAARLSAVTRSGSCGRNRQRWVIFDPPGRKFYHGDHGDHGEIRSGNFIIPSVVTVISVVNFSIPSTIANPDPHRPGGREHDQARQPEEE